MKTIPIFGTRGLILILGAALGVSVGFASPAFAHTSVIVNPDGKVTYLGTLGGSSSRATDINNAGQVVGVSNTEDGSTHAFITGPDGIGMTDLGTLGGTYSEALGINDIGQVAGVSNTEDGSMRAFITGPNGAGITDLGTLGGDSRATGINDAGQVVGYSEPAGPYSHAFITGLNGIGMTDLVFNGFASGINDSGQVIGHYRAADGVIYAFITGPNGMGITHLGTLIGDMYPSQPYGINDSGQVVGYVETENGSVHAFITGPNGMGMTDLGTLGGRHSSAQDINDAGQVVGSSITKELDQFDQTRHAFVTGPNGVGMTDLNSYADLPDGTYLQRALGINNLGQVIAITPIPEPASYALMLAGLGLVGFMVRQKKLPQYRCARLKKGLSGYATLTR